MKFNIPVHRKSSSVKLIPVQAENFQKAQKLALNCAGSYEFESSQNYEFELVDGIMEVGFEDVYLEVINQYDVTLGIYKLPSGMKIEEGGQIIQSMARIMKNEDDLDEQLINEFDIKRVFLNTYTLKGV